MHLLPCRAMQDYACAQEADAGNDALDDPAYVSLRVVCDRQSQLFPRLREAADPEGEDPEVEADGLRVRESERKRAEA